MSEHYECPNCGRRNSLWEGVEVPGWRSIDDQLQPCCSRGIDHEVEWGDARPDGTVGCGECAWEGVHREMRRVVLGNDGEPLPEVHPQQLEIPS